MRKNFLRTIAGTGLLVFGLSCGAVAQDRDRDHDRDRDDSYYRTREGYFRGEHWRAQLFQRVRDDLNYVQGKTFPVGRDEFRIARTKDELNELQSKLASGRFDQPELDNVIAGLQRVVSDNRLSPRDRDMLNDDLTRMRDFRARHDDYGAR